MATLIIVIRAVYFVATLQLFGLLIFRLVFSPREFGGRGFRSVCLFSVSLVILAMACWLPVEAGSMGGENIGDAIADGTVGTVLADTRFGHFWAARLVLFLSLGAILLWNGRLAPWLAALLAGLALALSAASGHAGANTGWPGALQLAGDMFHLAAAGAWIGGLIPFAWIITRYVRARDAVSLNDAYDAAHRFSVLGIVCVGTILVTGSINFWFLVGNVPALIGTDYGHLLSLKIALFAIVVGIAAVNWLRLTPLVHRGAIEALAALRRNAGIEAALGLVIVAIVGLLGTLPPAAHDEPVWPFSFRVTWTPFPAIAKAYPTSFAHSPIAYAAPSTARGRSVYAKNCVACHGAEGRGDGPAAAGLAVRPADFIAHNLFAHLDGELFWWISRGIGDSMPAFDGTLNETQRWDAINFIRALNAGFAARKVPSEIRDAPPPLMPDFALEIGGHQQTLNQMLRQSAMLLVLIRMRNAKPYFEWLATLEPRLREAGLMPIPISLDDRRSGTIPAALTVAPDVAETLALFADKNEVTSVYLVDGNSYIRARWHGGHAEGLPDAGTLIGAVEKMKALPIARAAHHH